MNKENNATETNAPAIAPEETTVSDDAEARIAALEAEKAKYIEESANYKVAYLKERSKRDSNALEGETDEDKMRRIAAETLADSRLAEIAREQDAIIKKALKENKELKLAHLNKTGVPTSMTSSTESPGVRDTLVTPEQERNFRQNLKWDDKTIERYKKNLARYGTR